MDRYKARLEKKFYEAQPKTFAKIAIKIIDDVRKKQIEVITNGAFDIEDMEDNDDQKGNMLELFAKSIIDFKSLDDLLVNSRVFEKNTILDAISKTYINVSATTKRKLELKFYESTPETFKEIVLSILTDLRFNDSSKIYNEPFIISSLKIILLNAQHIDIDSLTDLRTYLYFKPELVLAIGELDFNEVNHLVGVFAETIFNLKKEIDSKREEKYSVSDEMASLIRIRTQDRLHSIHMNDEINEKATEMNNLQKEIGYLQRTLKNISYLIGFTLVQINPENMSKEIWENFQFILNNKQLPLFVLNSSLLGAIESYNHLYSKFPEQAEISVRLKKPILDKRILYIFLNACMSAVYPELPNGSIDSTELAILRKNINRLIEIDAIDTSNQEIQEALEYIEKRINSSPQYIDYDEEEDEDEY